MYGEIRTIDRLLDLLQEQILGVEHKDMSFSIPVNSITFGKWNC